MHDVRNCCLVAAMIAAMFIVVPIAHAETVDTGIVVHAKTYDERAIQQLIAQIDTRLGQLEFIRQESLQATTGGLVGGSRQGSNTQFNISTNPTPGITTVAAPPVDGGDPVTTSTTTEASVTPTIPSTAQSPLTYSAPSGFSLSARDLLSEQLELSYRVAGLRLGLERSIEDHFEVQHLDQRRLALVGVDVSIDETRVREGAVAEVRLEVVPVDPKKPASSETDNAGSEQEPGLCSDVQPTLVQLLPQRESYNRVSITDKKSQIGFGLLAGIIQLGLGNNKNSENLYVVQELDTISYRFAAGHENQLSVGWRFRPSLQQHQVSPGLRKVFFLVSLPDEIGKQDNSTQCVVPAYTIYAKTAWREWDPKTRRTGRILKAGRQYLQSNWDEIRTLTYKQDDFKAAFNPYISGIDWQELDKEVISAVVSGTSFFNDLEVLAGGKRLSVGAGINLLNPERFRLDIPISALFDMPQGLVIGRYGSEGWNALALQYAYHEDHTPSVSAKVRALDTKYAELALALKNYPNEHLDTHGIPSRALIRIGSKIYGGRARPVISRKSDKETPGCKEADDAHETVEPDVIGDQPFCDTVTNVHLRVPIADLLSADGIVVVEPFFPHTQYRKFIALSEVEGLYRAEAAGKAPIAGNANCRNKNNEPVCSAYAILSPTAFTGRFDAHIGQVKLAKLTNYPNTANRQYFQIPNSLVSATTPVTISHDSGEQWFIPLKKTATPAKISISKVEDVGHNDERWVQLDGSGVAAVTSVLIGERELPFQVSADNKSIRVYFDGRLTRNPGIRELVLISKDNKKVYAKIIVKKAG